ncbi:MAG: homoserine dehydrogenase [Sphingomonadaceae bacterium]
MTSQKTREKSKDTPLRVGLAGLGTVGGGVIRVLATHARLIEQRAGRPIQVTAVSARDRSRKRSVDLSDYAWEDDALALVQRPDVDVVVELVGGADGPALTLARAALAADKPFVTANKAMLAHHGLELATLAESRGLPLKYEAAVAGGVPIIKTLREGMAANSVSRVAGILNGTCNYILSRMEAEGLEFAAVLADAQRLGFAEADPAFDIDGVDAAHKLAILAAIAFGAQPDFTHVETSGIRDVRTADIAQAAALGYRVRLVGQAEVDAAGTLLQRVHPTLVPVDHPLAAVTGPLNAVVIDGDFVGRLLLQGAGAGEGPTASAVVADLVDIARGANGPVFATPVAQLAALPPAGSLSRSGSFYLRLTVMDRPGVLADLTAALRDSGVSIESIIQPAPTADDMALVVMVTHETTETAVRRALAAMQEIEAVCGAPLWMPIIANEGSSE